MKTRSECKRWRGRAAAGVLALACAAGLGGCASAGGGAGADAGANAGTATGGREGGFYAEWYDATAVVLPPPPAGAVAPAGMR